MPKEVTVKFTGGTEETFPGENNVASELLRALTDQHPAHPVQVSETEARYLNMRQVESLTVTTTPDPEPTPEPAPNLVEQTVVTQTQPLETGEEKEQESAPLGQPQGEEDVSETDTPDTRTVAELKAALDKAGVDYPSTALKADLLDLAKTHNA